jgi:hypothetical protein
MCVCVYVCMWRRFYATVHNGARRCEMEGPRGLVDCEKIGLVKIGPHLMKLRAFYFNTALHRAEP